MITSNRRKFLKQSAAAGFALWATPKGPGAEPKTAEPRLPTLLLEGPPRQRGLTHGKALKEQIHELLKLWKADLAARYKVDASAFLKKFLERTDFPAAMKKWTPDLLDEIAGIAAGAGADPDTILGFQLMDEYLVHGPGLADDHCSSLGVARRGDRPSIVAQTLDLEGFRDGFQAVLHIRYPGSKLEALVVTHAGLIGWNGMNSRAIGVCCNTLGQLAYCGDGLPVNCVVRGLLERETEAAAVDFLRRVKHASGQNYLIGGPDKVHDFECSAGKLIRFTPAAGPDVLWHTNHPLVSDDYNAVHRKALAEKATMKEANSRTRLQTLEKRLDKGATRPDIDGIKAILASKDSAEYPVCRPLKNAQDNFTFASTIMVLSAKPVLHLAPGPGNIRVYRTLSFPG
jgi:hypothetical protein